MKKRERYLFIKKIKYRLDDFVSKGFWAQIALLAGTSISLTLLFGIVAMHLGEPNYTEGYWTSLMHMIDQGTITGDEEGSNFFFMFMMFVTLVGMAFTSTIIAIINTGIQEKLNELKKGHSGIIEKNHVVILGFDANTYTVCREIVQGQRIAGEKICLVVADNLPKDEMEHTARELRSGSQQLFEKSARTQIKEKKKIKILFRSGDLISNNTFSICAVEKARSIVINREDDLETIRILLALSAYLKKHNAYISDETMPSVVALIHNQEHLSAARIAAGISFGASRSNKQKNEYKIRIMYSRNTLSRLFAQSCVNQGLPFVMDGLFNYRGASVYIEKSDASGSAGAHPFSGKTLSEITAMLPDSIPLGFVRKSTKKQVRVLLNPSEAVRYAPGDLLIHLSESPDLRLAEAESTPLAEIGVPVYNRVASEDILRSFLLIGRSTGLQGMVKNICEYCAAGSFISVISPDAAVPDDYDSDTFPLHVCPCESPYDWNQVKQLLDANAFWFDRTGPRHLTNIVILSQDDIEKLPADEQVMVLLLNIRRYLKEKAAADVSITSEMHLPQNQLLVQTDSSNDFVVASEISNRMMAQIATDPRKYYIIQVLLEQRSGMIELHPVSDYVDLSQDFNFACIFRTAAGAGDGDDAHAIPLGWIRIGQDPVLTESEDFDPDDSDEIFDEKDSEEAIEKQPVRTNARLVLNPTREELELVHAGGENYDNYRLIVLKNGNYKETENI